MAAMNSVNARSSGFARRIASSPCAFFNTKKMFSVIPPRVFYSCALSA